jgi:hypothetical protein
LGGIAVIRLDIVTLRAPESRPEGAPLTGLPNSRARALLCCLAGKPDCALGHPDLPTEHDPPLPSTAARFDACDLRNGGR